MNNSTSQRSQREPYIGSPMTRFRPMPKSSRADAEPVRRHLLHLVSVGMTPCMISRAAGLSQMPAHEVLSDTRQTMLEPAARALLAVTPRPNAQQALVLSYGARRRLEGLAVMGWSIREIARRANVQDMTVKRPRSAPRVQWRVHTLIADVYEELSHIRRDNTRTVLWAEANGFVHPMLWDDIDDYYEVPVEPVDSKIPDEIVIQRLADGRAVDRASKAERAAAVQILTDRGLSSAAIAERMRVSQRQVVRDRGMAVAS